MKYYKIIITSNEVFETSKYTEENLQIFFIKEELEKGLKFLAGITESNKLRIEVIGNDLDVIFNFKKELERKIFDLTNHEESYTFNVGVGYGD